MKLFALHVMLFWLPYVNHRKTLAILVSSLGDVSSHELEVEQQDCDVAATTIKILIAVTAHSVFPAS